VKTIRTILDEILIDVRKELAVAQAERPLPELKKMIPDAPPVRPFRSALQSGFGLIAEIKERSPSHGAMRKENVKEALAAYEQSPVVRALSVLTNQTHFGMSMERLRQARMVTTKPVLRKDFIFDDYQVYEARAFGADAILLMANMLEGPEMTRLYDLARELGMNGLFECHNREQIAQVPVTAEIYGINSRTFDSSAARYTVSAMMGKLGAKKDFTIETERFELGQFLPVGAIKVAESGVAPNTVARLRDELRYDAALVGTSLLTAARGVSAELRAFETALCVA
jgi:indole-3-glycerol phosphate synthase